MSKHGRNLMIVKRLSSFPTRTSPPSISNIWKPGALTILVGVGSYTVSIWYYQRKHRRYLLDHNHNFTYHPTITSTISKIKDWWRHQLYHDKFFYNILMLNTCVFLSWRVKRFHPFMSRYFLSSPQNRSSSSLVLSTFSHLEVWHFAINMIVLWSFVPPFIALVGRELSWPFYLTAGVFSSSMGYYSKILRGLHSVPSLGASGALMAIATLVVLNHPDSSLYIVFLPFIPIPAYMGLSGVVLLDVVGLVRGWRLFDHAAHLGGALAGLSFYKWGHDLITFVRPKLKQFINYLSQTRLL